MTASWRKNVNGEQFTVGEYALCLIRRYGSSANRHALRLVQCSTHAHTRLWYFVVAAAVRDRERDKLKVRNRIYFRDIAVEEHACLMLLRYGRRAREYALDRMRGAALADTRQHYAAVAELIPEIREVFSLIGHKGACQ